MKEQLEAKKQEYTARMQQVVHELNMVGAQINELSQKQQLLYKEAIGLEKGIQTLDELIQPSNIVPIKKPTKKET